MNRSVGSFFLFSSNPEKYLSLDRDITFCIHLGIHLSNKGLKLVYYYLYYVESSFPMDVCPHPFNSPFIVFVQT